MPRFQSPVVLPGNPSSALQAATKQYVDAIVGTPPNGWVDVKAAGATGNGSTDDTTAINNAISGSAVGAVIYFPPGTYMVSGTIILLPSRTYLGMGGLVTQTTLRAAAAFPSGLPIMAAQGWYNSATVCDAPIRIEGLQLDGNNVAGVSGLVVFNYWSRFRDLQVLNINGSAADGVLLTDVGRNTTTVTTNSHSENTFDWCRFDHFTNSANAIRNVSQNNNSNQDGHITNTYFSSITGGGVLLNRAAGWYVQNNHFYGIGLDAIYADASYGTTISHNYIEDFGGKNSSVNAAPDFGYYNGINLYQLDGRASVIANNHIATAQPDPPTGLQWTAISITAGSSQLRASVVCEGNATSWAANTAPATMRSIAIDLGVRTGGALLVQLGDNLIGNPTWWQITRRVGTGVTVNEPGGVPTGRLITAGTGLTGGGDLSVDRTLAVSYGTAAGTSAQGNDTRLSDARTPTAHASTHRAGGTDTILDVVSAVKTAAYTIADTDSVVLVNPNGTTTVGVTITLPTAVGRTGKRFTVKKIGNANSSPVIVNTTASQTIDGNTSELIYFSGGFMTLLSDGANWHVVGGKVEPVLISYAAIAAAGTWTLDATYGTNFFTSASGSTMTLAAPINPVAGVPINLEINATVATTLTIAAAISLTTGLSATVSIPVGKRWFGGLRYSSGAAAWILLASTVQL